MDLTSRIQNFFAKRQGKPAPKQAPTPSPIQQAAQDVNYNFWHSPVGKGLVGAQKFIESNKSIGLPQVPEKYNPTIKVGMAQGPLQIPVKPVQIARDFVNAPVSFAANSISDMGQNLARTFTGRQNAQYENLKSPATKFGYQLSQLVNPQATQGYAPKMNPQEFIANTAETVAAPFSIYGGGKVFGVGKNAFTDSAKHTLPWVLKKEAKLGAALGGVGGVLGGLSQGRDETLENQLLGAAGQGALGTAAGAVTSGALAGGGYGLGSMKNKLVTLLRNKYGMDDKQANATLQRFARDEFGRFSGNNQIPPGLNNNLGDPKYALIVNDLRQTLRLPENYQSGFIDFNADLGGGKKKGEFFSKKPVEEKVPQEFRVDKVTPDEIEQDVLRRSQFRVGKEFRGVRHFEDMQADARELEADLPRLLNKETKRLNDAEVTALGNIEKTSAARVNELSNKLEQTPDDLNLKQQLQTELDFLDRVVNKRLEAGTAGGQTVVAFKQLANKTLDPTFWRGKAKKQLGTEKLDAEVIKKIDGFIAAKDRLGLADYIAKLKESSLGEKAVGTWKAGLLTGFRTHEGNMLSGEFMKNLETVKDIPATMFDIARVGIGKMFGKDTKRAKDFSFGGAVSQLKGLKEGKDRAWQIMKSGQDPKDLAKTELRKPLVFGKTPGGRILQGFTNAVFRTLGAEDKLFFEQNYKRSLDEQMRLAKINKLDVTEPTPEMKAIAEKDAEYATLTNENALNDALSGFKRSKNPFVKYGSEFLMPFSRTPTNAAIAGFVDYSPAGFVKAIGGTAHDLLNKKPVDTKQLAEEIGRATTGSAIIALGAELAKRGLVATTPKGEAERAQWENDRKTQNSVFFNGEWHQVSKLGPAGTLILLGAASHENNGDLNKTTAAGLKGFSEYSFLQGASSGLKAINEPERYGGALLENAAAGYIPTIFNDVASGIDPVGKRDPKGFQEKFMARTPVLREQVPAKLTSLGETVPNQQGLGGRMFNPFNSSKPNEDPLVKEMSRIGYNLNYTGDTIAKQKLTREQEREYQKLAGKYIKELVPVAMQDEEYKAGGLDVQYGMIEKAVNEAKRQAREEMKEKLGLIKDDSLFEAEASEGITFEPANKNKDFTLKDKSKEKTRFSFKVNGKTRNIELDYNIKEPELTGDGKVDKELIARYKDKIATEKRDLYTLYENKKISKQELQEGLAKLEKETAGAGSGKGGRKKGSRAKVDFAAIFTRTRPKIKPLTFRRTSVKKVQRSAVSHPQIKDLKFTPKEFSLKDKKKTT